MAQALKLALVAFTGTALFSSNAYAYYFPMLAGLCVAFERAVAARTASATPAPNPNNARPVPAWAQPQTRRPDRLAWKNLPSR